MKSRFSFAMPAAAVLVAVTLAGCATGPTAQQHRQGYPEAAAAQGRTGMGPGGHGMMMSEADMKAMCDRHEKMMSATTPEQRMAMMDEHMKGMSPEMRQQHMQKHMEMMQMHCK